MSTCGASVAPGGRSAGSASSLNAVQALREVGSVALEPRGASRAVLRGVIEIETIGAAGTVTGSKHLVRTSCAAVLLDCGLFQGRRSESFPQPDPRSRCQLAGRGGAVTRAPRSFRGVAGAVAQRLPRTHQRSGSDQLDAVRPGQERALGVPDRVARGAVAERDDHEHAGGTLDRRAPVPARAALAQRYADPR